MGTVLDIYDSGSYDYVDNQYWSVFQVKVKNFAFAKPYHIADLDKGKVLLFVNMNIEDMGQAQSQSDFELKNLQRILNKYASVDDTHKNGQFGVYAQFSYDVAGGDSMTNKHIARSLIDKGFLHKDVTPQSIRFLEKVDINGQA